MSNIEGVSCLSRRLQKWCSVHLLGRRGGVSPPTVKHSINEEQCGFRGKEERQAGGPPVYLVLYSPSQGSPPSTQSDTQAQRAAVSGHTEGICWSPAAGSHHECMHVLPLSLLAPTLFNAM